MTPARFVGLVAAMLLAGALAACGGGGGSSGGSTAPPPAVAAPVITSHPLDFSVSAGESGHFAVTATGSAPLAYQWRRNDVQISGAIASGYTTDPTTLADDGARFSVTVSNAGGTVTSSAAVLTVTPSAGPPPFGHVAIIVLENRDYADVYGNTTQMPYFNGLIASHGLATQYYANTHPSIGNYFMMTTGQVLTNSDSKTPASFPIAADNVVRRLLARGLTWKSYAEDLPSVGYIGGNTADYLVRHNPLAYFTDVQYDDAQRQNLVPFPQLAADLAAGKLPHYAFLVPDSCHDGHDCPLDVVDDWLASHVPPLLESAPFRDDGLFVIVFDEASNDDNAYGGGRIVTTLISPAWSKAGYQSTTFYQHESLLRLTLEGLGVGTVPGAGATAPPMWEFFTFPAP